MDRWELISGIVRTALALEPHERRAYLEATCEADDALRRQVEALLATSDPAGTGPILVSRLASDTLFAHYRIMGELGAGGMGEVYRARDERLDREVAVKVLPVTSFGDPAARERLVREAKAAAALNHPNVCTVYEVGEVNGQAYIAMELIQGRTLSALLDSGPLPLPEIVSYARQLSDALSHAHDRGIIHRDLKSHNVMVTPDQRVKVLDFGLAKRSLDSAPTSALTEMHHSLTQPGTAMGTLPYMAPEQLHGQPARISSDIWALGVVVYEMAAGARPFRGQTSYEISAAILGSPPAPLPSALPRALDRVVGRCLEKDPADRFHTAGEVRTALDTILDPPLVPRTKVDAPPDLPGRTRQPARRLNRSSLRTAAILVAVAVAAISAWGGWQFWPQRVRTLAVLPFVNVAKDADSEYLSDGIAETLIAHIGRQVSVSVVNLANVLPFKARDIEPRDAGRELGVETIVAGSVEQRGRRLLISSVLIDVASGHQLWSSQYDRDAVELLDLQDEMAQAIINEGLGIRLSGADAQRLTRHPTTDGDAYDLYLQARHIQRSGSEEDYLYSRELLKRAIVRDPNFAIAYAALSGNYGMMVVDGMERPTDAWPQVSRYMKQALAIDPDLPDVHAMAHAIAFLFDWDWAETERARRRLLQFPLRDLDPQFLRAVAVERWALGHPDEALQLARRMRELDPSSSYLGTLEADYLVNAGQFEAAVPLYERSIRLDPANPNAHFGLADARARQRRFDEAIDARRRAHQVAGDTALAEVLAGARGEAGYRAIDRAWVVAQLDALKARQATSYTSPLDWARAYAQLGDGDAAFRYLDASFADRAPGLVFLKVDRAWDLVRDDPRFAEAIARVGLP